MSSQKLTKQCLGRTQLTVYQINAHQRQKALSDSYGIIGMTIKIVPKPGPHNFF